MPFDDSLWLEDPDDFPQLGGHPLADDSQPGQQHSQRQFLAPWQPHRLNLFTLIDRQLPAR